MPVNPYFKDYSEEQDLVEDLTIETIKAIGRDMVYIPREKWNQDTLFGEQTGVYFSIGIPLEMYLDTPTGFPGQGDIASKFGIEIKDNIDFTISKKRFIQEVQTRQPEIIRPREGDLIFFPLAKAIFEINFVEHENPFYQHGKLYCYKLACSLWSYNHEEVQTGNTDIDNVQTEQNDIAQSTENTVIENLDKDNNIIDFSEIDPFSEGNY
jgi:hypothetical protein